jgi:hypothetical protein
VRRVIGCRAPELFRALVISLPQGDISQDRQVCIATISVFGRHLSISRIIGWFLAGRGNGFATAPVGANLESGGTFRLARR